MENFRIINDRSSDGIDVKLWWKDATPPEFQVTVDDWKLGQTYEPIPATLETFQNVFRHPMSYLADIATKAAYGVDHELGVE